MLFRGRNGGVPLQKPTALCLAIDKKNSIEFLLNFLYYLYNYYMVCALLSHAYHVTYHVM